MKMQTFVGKLRLVAAAAALVALAACSSQEFVNPIPSGYKGATAKISDSYSHNTGDSAHFYVVNAVDGLPIVDSGYRTRKALSGRTTRMDPQIAARWVKAEQQTFTITAYVEYASKAQAMFGDEMMVSGDVTFTPEPNGRYIVKGKLSKDGYAVWIADVSGKVVSEKVTASPEAETASR